MISSPKLFASDFNLSDIENEAQIITSYVDYYFPDSAEHFSSALNYLDSFKASNTGYLNFDYFHKEVWLHFNIEADRSDEIVLELHPYYVNQVQLDHYSFSTLQTSYKTGVDYKKMGKAAYFNGLRYAFPIVLDSGTNHLFIKSFAPYTSNRAILKVWDEEQYEEDHFAYWEVPALRYIITGFCFFASFFGLVLFLYNRKRVFLLYSIFIICNLIFIYTLRGWIFPYLELFKHYSYDIRGLFNAIVGAASLLYFKALIPKKYSSKILRILFSSLAIIISSLVILSIIISDNYPFYTAMVWILKPILLLIVPFALLHFGIAIKRSHKVAWFYVLSLLPVTVFSFLHFFELANMFSAPFPNFYWEFAILFELMSYTAGMVYFYQSVVTEKNDLLQYLKRNEVESFNTLIQDLEAERMRIARDLHDSIGQKLAAVRMNLSTLDLAENERKPLDSITTMLDDTSGEIRSISHNLFPEELKTNLFEGILNLRQTLSLDHQSRFKTDFIKEYSEYWLSREQELHLYRIIQELTHNFFKYNDSGIINLDIFMNESLFNLEMKDSGKTILKEDIEKSKGIGWKNIYARCTLIEANFQITEQKPQGNKISIQLQPHERN